MQQQQKKYKGPPPLVTGISPKEGPPGTKVTIRGENLGESANDLVALVICNVDCYLSAEWKSSSKIVARTGAGKGKGEVIVLTRSGGIGTSTVTFRGFFVYTGPCQESAVWVDESKTISAMLTRNRPMSPVILKENEDPLGLSDEGSVRKYTDEELLEIFPDSSGNISLNNFSAQWFLLENHEDKGFEDLKAGLTYLKRRDKNRAEGPLAFVKQNLSTFMECQDTLEAMHTRLMSDNSRRCIENSCITNDLHQILGNANFVADKLFQDVLKRKDTADSTRNALSVLNRFRFLFYLPVMMKRNIQKGDYDLVINDYARVKSLFGDTEVQLFKKVYKEIESQINDFREILHDKLLKVPSSLEEQKKIIRYLVELGAPGDPAWQCLENQHTWVLSLFKDCKDTYIQFEKSKQTESEFKTPVKPAKAQLAHPTNLKSATPHPPSLNVPGGDPNAGKFKTPQKVEFVESLTDVLSDTFPDLWRLGQAYFSGTLSQRETEKPTTKHTDQARIGQFKTMITDIVKEFVYLLRAAFLPTSLDNLKLKDRNHYGVWPEDEIETPGEWLPYCVRFIRTCVGKLLSLDLYPYCLSLVQELAFDMRTHCMSVLLSKAISGVQQLDKKEAWVVDMDDEFGGTTQLPLLFENIVNETLQHLHEVATKQKPGEVEIFSQRPIQKMVIEMCVQLLRSFRHCLAVLAFKPRELPQTLHNPAVQAAVAADLLGHSTYMTQNSGGDQDSHKDDEFAPSEEKRIIITLNNCNHTVHTVLPRLVDSLAKHKYPETNKILTHVKGVYEELNDTLFESYTEAKSNPIVGAMEQNMYQAKFDWHTLDRNSGVRSYLKIALVGLIEVHAEVYAISPQFVPKVLEMVVQSVSDELVRLILCVDNFSHHGVVQAVLEVRAFDEALNNYHNSESKAALQEALDYVLRKGKKSSRIGSGSRGGGETEEAKWQALIKEDPYYKKIFSEVRPLQDKFDQQMRFELTCFKGVQEPAESNC